MSTLNDLIKEYIQIDDKISDINSGLKELRESKKDIENDIKEHMKMNNLETLEFGNDTFVLKETTKTKSLTEKTIVSGLLKFVSVEELNKIGSVLFKDLKTQSESLQRKTRKL
jgi:hypothetical protein